MTDQTARTARDYNARATTSNDPSVAHRQLQLDPNAAFYRKEGDYGFGADPTYGAAGSSGHTWSGPPNWTAIVVILLAGGVLGGWAFYEFSLRPAQQKEAQIKKAAAAVAAAMPTQPVDPDRDAKLDVLARFLDEHFYFRPGQPPSKLMAELGALAAGLGDVGKMRFGALEAQVKAAHTSYFETTKIEPGWLFDREVVVHQGALDRTPSGTIVALSPTERRAVVANIGREIADVIDEIKRAPDHQASLAGYPAVAKAWRRLEGIRKESEAAAWW